MDQGVGAVPQPAVAPKQDWNPHTLQSNNDHLLDFHAEQR
jgi:hypothetical protein